MKLKNLIFKGVICLFIMAIFMPSIGNTVKAAEKKYSFTGDECSKFKKSGRKLTITVIKHGYNGIRLNQKRTNKNKLVLKLSKHCNWSYTPGGAPPYKKSNYKKIKNQISREYNYRKKHGDYDSPSIVTLTLKHGKISRVNISWF